MLVIERGECREQRWYDYTPVPFSSPKEDKEATHELLDLYRAAVRRHLLSDVPVGILLSGGLDSGLLLALMNEQGGPGRPTPSDTEPLTKMMNWRTPKRQRLSWALAISR